MPVEPKASNTMEVYLPIAGVSVNLFLLLALGAAVGFLSGMFGVGGGFLLTPLLILIGVPSTVAAASAANQIAAVSASAALLHSQKGNVDFRIGGLGSLGSLAGALMGVWSVRALHESGSADFAIRFGYVVLLGSLGIFMARESFRALRGGLKRGSSQIVLPAILARWRSSWPLQVPLGEGSVSALLPVAIGVVVGLLAALLGVGGGFLMVPAMVYLLGMPVLMVVGTSLFQIFFTMLSVTFLQAVTNHTVDLVLAVLLMLGSTVGARFGVGTGTRMRAAELRMLLSFLVLGVAVMMLAGLVTPPRQPLVLSTEPPGG